MKPQNKNKEKYEWTGDNNVRFVFVDKSHIEMEAKERREIIKTLDKKEIRFLHLGDKVTINLDNVIFIIWRNEDGN